MLLNRAKEGHAPAVVEQFGARSNAPEGRCAHFVRGLLAAGLHDTVASPNVVEKEVAVRVKDRVAQRRRDTDRASSDGCRSEEHTSTPVTVKYRMASSAWK